MLLGGGSASWDGGGRGAPGLIALLALFAGVALLFTTRSPRVSDFVLGLDRWVARVIAYPWPMNAAVVVARTQRGNDGFLKSGSENVSTATYAIASERRARARRDREALDAFLGTVRLRSESDRPVLVGIATASDVAGYLSGVSTRWSGLDPQLRRRSCPSSCGLRPGRPVLVSDASVLRLSSAGDVSAAAASPARDQGFLQREALVGSQLLSLALRVPSTWGAVGLSSSPPGVLPRE